MALNSQDVSDGRVPGSGQMEGCVLKGLPKCGISLNIVCFCDYDCMFFIVYNIGLISVAL